VTDREVADYVTGIPDPRDLIPITDVKHGVVGGSDDLPCHPECEPEKGIHVMWSEPE
jgi:hypothetical protein